MPTDSAPTGLDTFPRLLAHHAQVRGAHPAIREKDLGIWQTWTWAEMAAEVRSLACGLAAQGFRRGMHLAIIGDNRPRLYWAMAAAQALGGIPVPMYQDAPAGEFIYVLNDAEIAYAIVEDQEQVDKMLEAAPQVPTLKHIYYDDPRGLRNYEGVTSFESLQAQGREFDRAHPGFYDEEVARGDPADISVMLYTSGTTGKPKGVCQTHGAFIAAARGGCEFDRLTADDSILSYLPMAWVGDHLFSFAQMYVAGFSISCPESGDTVLTDLREIGPTYYFAPPRVFENLLTQVTIRMEDAGAVKRWLYRTFTTVARRCGAEILAGRSVPASDRLLYAIGNALVYAPLRNVLGMSRIRIAYTAGAAIGPDLFRFYRSIGVNLKQLYGSTETCAYVCLQPDGDVKLDTVGLPAPGVEVRIAGVGRSPGARPDAAQGVLQASRRDRRVDRRERILPHGRRRNHRRQRAPQDHRPREGRRPARGRRDVRAQLHREQAQVLRAREGGGRVRRSTRHGLRVHQHRHGLGRQLGRAAQHRLFRIHRPRRQARSPRADPRMRRAGQRRARAGSRAGRLAGAPLPHPAQGARPGRRRADAHAQGPPRLRRARNTRC